MSAIDRLLDVMSQLRDPESGCPWDQQQTFESLVPYTLEEAYEVADAIETQVPDDIRDELGDLLFQVVFYAQIAKEQQWFDFEQIADTIAEKLIRRHPHVFADEKVDSVAAQTEAWEEHKRHERESKQRDKTPSALEGVARALPALVRAQKLQRRAAKVGFDWDQIAAVYDKVQEEIIELQQAHQAKDKDKIEDELGDVLFAVVNLARFVDVDAETALRRSSQKFERRFHQVEHLVAEQNADMKAMTVFQLEQLWKVVKQHE